MKLQKPLAVNTDKLKATAKPAPNVIPSIPFNLASTAKQEGSGYVVWTACGLHIPTSRPAP